MDLIAQVGKQARNKEPLSVMVVNTEEGVDLLKKNQQVGRDIFIWMYTSVPSGILEGFIEAALSKDFVILLPTGEIKKLQATLISITKALELAEQQTKVALKITCGITD